MTADELWIPLVDEPIGGIVERLEREHAEIARLVDTPQRLLAFRTFAYIRVGLVLGQLLVDNDLPPYDGSDTWVDALLREPANRERIAREVLAVAEEVGGDAPAEDESVGPDPETRDRFREFARKQLESAGP